MIHHNSVTRKHQLRSMNATVYHMSDGAEVLKSYDTIVAIEWPDGTTAYSMDYIEMLGDYNGLKNPLYKTWNDVDSDYLEAIEVATGGHIG